METEPNTTLLIGYGNEYCGDDALGPTVVRLVDAKCLYGVKALIVHQLMPELAESLALAAQVIFVDATVLRQSSPIVLQRLRTSRDAAIRTHSCHPATLLELSQLLYGRMPPAWLVTIEGSRFGPGDLPSALARRYATSAADMIACWLQTSTGKPQALQPMQ